MIETPELDKLAAIREKSQCIGEFMDSLSTQGLYLCQVIDVTNEPDDYGDLEEVYMPTNFPIEKLLAGYFGIDLQKCEEERMALLEDIRKQS